MTCQGYGSNLWVRVPVEYPGSPSGSGRQAGLAGGRAAAWVCRGHFELFELSVEVTVEDKVESERSWGTSEVAQCRARASIVSCLRVWRGLASYS